MQKPRNNKVLPSPSKAQCGHKYHHASRSSLRYLGLGQKHWKSHQVRTALVGLTLIRPVIPHLSPSGEILHPGMERGASSLRPAHCLFGVRVCDPFTGPFVTSNWDSSDIRRSLWRTRWIWTQHHDPCAIHMWKSWEMRGSVLPSTATPCAPASCFWTWRVSWGIANLAGLHCVIHVSDTANRRRSGSISMRSWQLRLGHFYTTCALHVDHPTQDSRRLKHRLRTTVHRTGRKLLFLSISSRNFSSIFCWWPQFAHTRITNHHCFADVQTREMCQHISVIHGAAEMPQQIFFLLIDGTVLCHCMFDNPIWPYMLTIYERALLQ